MAMLIVLNDGTDEIFNIHAFDIESRSQLFWDLLTTFWTCPAAKDLLNELLPDDNDWYLNWIELLIKDKLETSYFFLAHEESSEVEKKVKMQNLQDIELYREEDFNDWNDIVSELHILTGDNWDLMKGVHQ